MRRSTFTLRILVSLLSGSLLIGCGGSQAGSAAVVAAPQAPQGAPNADVTGGFDGQRAFQHVADLVAIGPRIADTEGGRKARQYIVSKLQSFGCPVTQETFHAETPAGNLEMTNVIAKIPGAKPDILLFTTHFDTKRLPNFVGADDGGSSTGVMLELARLLCARKNSLTTWVVFFDGEEAVGEWSDADSTYGSRELSARMAISGDLARVKAMILADIVGYRDLRIKRELNSTPWLSDLIWSTAARLGYGTIFVSQGTPIEDDHLPFLRRHVAAADIIDLEIPYWHTPDDTLDKISPRSLSVVGHVLVEILPALEQRFSGR